MNGKSDEQNFIDLLSFTEIKKPFSLSWSFQLFALFNTEEDELKQSLLAPSLVQAFPFNRIEDNESSLIIKADVFLVNGLDVLERKDAFVLDDWDIIPERFWMCEGLRAHSRDDILFIVLINDLEQERLVRARIVLEVSSKDVGSEVVSSHFPLLF